MIPVYVWPPKQINSQNNVGHAFLYLSSLSLSNHIILLETCNTAKIAREFVSNLRYSQAFKLLIDRVLARSVAMEK